MWEEKDWSRVLGAPGSNNYGGLLASSTSQTIGAKANKLQALSKREAKKLFDEHQSLVRGIAWSYSGKGIAFGELVDAGSSGLGLALRKFDPERGPFEPYARPWIKGEIRALFKPGADALGVGRSISLDAPQGVDSSGKAKPALIDQLADESRPAITIDLSALSEVDRDIIEARSRGETLREIGARHGRSAERIRQREARARTQIKGSVASDCLFDLTQRGNVIRFPVERTRRWEEFRDREPPKHVYREPELSWEVAHHRARAVGLHSLRGNEVIRNERGPYGGPIIHEWWQP